jgi:hypothetical protein
MAIQKAGRLQFQDMVDVVGVGAFTVDFGNAATGSGTFAKVTVTVPGAALGDFVFAGPGIDALDAVIGGSVTSADTVELVLLNNTAGAVDLGSQKLRLMVLRLNAQYDIV